MRAKRGQHSGMRWSGAGGASVCGVLVSLELSMALRAWCVLVPLLLPLLLSIVADKWGRLAIPGALRVALHTGGGGGGDRAASGIGHQVRSQRR